MTFGNAKSLSCVYDGGSNRSDYIVVIKVALRSPDETLHQPSLVAQTKLLTKWDWATDWNWKRAEGSQLAGFKKWRKRQMLWGRKEQTKNFLLNENLTEGCGTRDRYVWAILGILRQRSDVCTILELSDISFDSNSDNKYLQMAVFSFSSNMLEKINILKIWVY